MPSEFHEFFMPHRAFFHAVFMREALSFALTTPGSASMGDVLYVAGTIVFFALMLAYVRGCARLGRPARDMSELS